SGGDARLRHRRVRDGRRRVVRAEPVGSRDGARPRRRSLRPPRLEYVRARRTCRICLRGNGVIETETPPERAYLVGVELPRSRLDGDDSLDELGSLVEAAGGIGAGRTLPARA